MSTLGQDFAFLRRPEIAVSSWVVEYAYVERRRDGMKGLLVSYLPEEGKSGPGPGHKPRPTTATGIPKSRIVTCFYPNTPESLFDSIDAAPSKGKWVHANIFRSAYEIVE